MAKPYDPSSLRSGLTAKKCQDCRRLLSIDNFSRLRYTPDGLQRQCRTCLADAARRNRARKFGIVRPEATRPSPVIHNLTNQHVALFAKAKEVYQFRCVGFHIPTVVKYRVEISHLPGSHRMVIFEGEAIRYDILTAGSWDDFLYTAFGLLRKQDIRLEENEVTMSEALSLVYYL